MFDVRGNTLPKSRRERINGLTPAPAEDGFSTGDSIGDKLLKESPVSGETFCISSSTFEGGNDAIGFPTGVSKGGKVSSDSMDSEECSESRDSSESSSCVGKTGTKGRGTGKVEVMWNRIVLTS